MLDVLIIGGGVVGCLIARELSKYMLDCCLLEKEWDVAMGASGANSGIVHAGYDPKPGTAMAKFNVEGHGMFAKITRELDVPFVRNGSLVLAFCEEEEKKLQTLMEYGIKNGVQKLSLLSREQILRLDPRISKNVTKALYAPTAGIVCPYTLTISASENAAQNGVEIRMNQEVTGITRKDGAFVVRTQNNTYFSKCVVNCTGVFSDMIAELAGAEKHGVIARKGEYFLFDKTAQKPNQTLFQSPAAGSKGVLVTSTVHGNLLVGPTATDTEDKEDTSVSGEGLAYVAETGRRSFVQINLKETITQFAGLRAIAASRDFVIEPSKKVKGFIHVAGICSPGLTAAPAIAKHVAVLLEREGLKFKEKKDFNPLRLGIKSFDSLPEDEKNRLIKSNPAYGKIICRCEHITEAEVVESIQRGAKTIDGVKRRVRAGMGRCQGGFCSPAVLSLLAKELNVPLEQVTKRGDGSNILFGKTK